MLFRSNDTATTEIYTLSLHDALPISDKQPDGADEVVVGVAVVAVTAVLLGTNLDFIVANYHFISAIGLFVCIVAVAVSNAVRRQGIVVPGSGLAMAGPGLRAGVTALRPQGGRGPNLYAGFAWALLVVAAVGVIAVRAGLVSLFWLELVAALLFILFWLAQTFAELPRRPQEADAGAQIAANKQA